MKKEKLLEEIKSLKKEKAEQELKGIKKALEDEKEWLSPLLIMFYFVKERLEYLDKCLEEINKS